MSSSEFTYSSSFVATDEMKAAFDTNGYIIIRGILRVEELNKIKKVFEENEEIQSHQWATDDGDGRKSRLTAWLYPGNDVTGIYTRSRRIVDTCSKLMGGEVYHYHSKIMMKDALSGGRFVWHQDYGYWYKNSLLHPDLLSVMTAIDKSSKENGCLEILEGSHKCGRVDHEFVGGQTGADVDRVNLIRQICPHKYVELEPGDAVFFHCNLLHMSQANISPKRRWVYISCFNLKSNNSIHEHHWASYSKIDVVPDAAIMECTNLSDMSGKHFADPSKNKTVIVAK